MQANVSELLLRDKLDLRDVQMRSLNLIFSYIQSEQVLSTLTLVSSHDELTTLQKKLSLPSGCGRTAT